MSEQTLHYFSVNFDDIDTMAKSLENWDALFLPLEVKQTRHAMSVLDSEAVTIQQFCIGQRVHQKAATPASAITFGFPSSNLESIEFNNYRINDSLIIFPSGQEYSCVSPADFNACSISISKNTLGNLAARYEINVDVEILGSKELVLSIPQNDRNQLGTILGSIFKQDSTDSANQRQLIEHDLPLKLLCIIAANKTNLQKNKHLTSYRALARAHNYITSNAFSPMKITDICKAAFAQERTIERAFRTYFDLTPTEYLRQVRLNNVRIALKNNSAATPISQIALNCGFTHLGRFSGYYRQQYGESPSETIGKFQIATPQQG